MEKITTKEWVLNIIVAIAIVGGIGFAIYKSAKAPEVDDSAFRNEFLSGCVSEASDYNYCNCTFDSLKKQMGIDGVLEFAVEYDRTGVLPKEAYTAIAECMDKI